MNFDDEWKGYSQYIYRETSGLLLFVFGDQILRARVMNLSLVGPVRVPSLAHSRARITTRLFRTTNLSFTWLHLLWSHGRLLPREDP
jgi:hypothetical protein